MAKKADKVTSIGLKALPLSIEEGEMNMYDDGSLFADDTFTLTIHSTPHASAAATSNTTCDSNNISISSSYEHLAKNVPTASPSCAGLDPKKNYHTKNNPLHEIGVRSEEASAAFNKFRATLRERSSYESNLENHFVDIAYITECLSVYNQITVSLIFT